jgi:formylglycine-generating enzyme required for sulfatase activity
MRVIPFSHLGTVAVEQVWNGLDSGLRLKTRIPKFGNLVQHAHRLADAIGALWLWTQTSEIEDATISADVRGVSGQTAWTDPPGNGLVGQSVKTAFTRFQSWERD